MEDWNKSMPSSNPDDTPLFPIVRSIRSEIICRSSLPVFGDFGRGSSPEAAFNAIMHLKPVSESVVFWAPVNSEMITIREHTEIWGNLRSPFTLPIGLLSDQRSPFYGRLLSRLTYRYGQAVLFKSSLTLTSSALRDPSWATL